MKNTIYVKCIILLFFYNNAISQTNIKKYNIVCVKDKSIRDGKGTTFEPLEIVSINSEDQSQVVQYSLDGRHELFDYFKRRSILRDSFSLQMQQYLIDTANLAKWENNNKLLILLKMGPDNRCMIIPDVNFSGKFSDDSVYYSTNIEKEEIIFNLKINFWYNKKYTKDIDFVIKPNPQYLPKSNSRAVFNTWGGARKIMTGKLILGLDSFLCKVYLMHHSVYYSVFNSRFSFSKPNENFMDLYENGYPIYKFSDSIYLGNKILMLDTLSILGDTIVFKEVGVNPEMRSVLKGGVLKDIWAKDFNKGEYKKINLIDSSKKYTLIHFWGSWCSPCIASLPKLKKLHEKYLGKVVFIGFPYESILDTVKTSRFIQKYDMNWQHFLQLRDDPFNKAEIVQNLRIESFPTYLLINSKGVIVARTSEIEEIVKYLSESNEF